MDQNVVTFYRIYRSKVGIFVRLCSVVFLCLTIVVGMLDDLHPSVIIFLLNILVMVEIYYRYHVCTLQSAKLVSQVSDKEALQVMTLPALTAVLSSHKASDIVNHLKSYRQVNFFINRAGILPSELPKTEMGNALLPQFAHKLANLVGGKRITTVDLLAAYLLLEEEQSQLLFSKKLKENDVIQILRWTRMEYPYEEVVRNLPIQVRGGGIGEFLVNGWTPETRGYTRDFSISITEQHPSIVGREKEYQLIKDTLHKSENNNILLVGEAGVGKEQLVRRLATDSYNGDIDSGLKYKNIIELLVGSLLAGATVQGDLEARIKAIIDEVSHAENVILYIPEFQDLLGGASFSLDLSGALAPYMTKGKLPIIASITEGNYKTFFEKSPLRELFSEIMITEPTQEVAELMIMEKVAELEATRSSIVSYKALVASLKYADKYSQSMLLPGSAIMLLSDALSTGTHTAGIRYGTTKKILLTEDSIIQLTEQKTKIALAEPTQGEKDLLLHLEEVLHQKIVGQNEAIRVISEALRRIRSGVEAVDKPISFLFLGPTGVGKTETAKTLANTYFGGEQTMIRLDMSEYADEAGQRRLLGALPGQGEERGELTEKVLDHPYSLILLDEFEKAHPSILNLFLQILEDGRLTDNKGKTVSFMNTIIIATSNAGSDLIRQAVSENRASGKVFETELLNYLQANHIYKPELLNRFDGVVTFTPLSELEIQQVTKLLLASLIKQLAEKDIVLVCEDTVLKKIAHEAYNPQFGARPIKRYIQDTIEDAISEKILQSKIVRGNHITISVNESNSFVISVVS